MRMLRTLLIAFLCLFLYSCQQEIEDVLTNPPANGNNNNNNTTGAGYQPLGAGSWWKYKDSTTGSLSTTTVTSVTKTFNSISYKAITGGNGDTAYMGVKGANYFSRVAGISPMGNPYDLTLNYLNDTASVGYTWQYNAGQGNGFAAVTYTTILEKGLTLTVEGKTYTDVIHTFIDFNYNMGGIEQPYAEYEFYIAKNVGIVKSRADLGPGLFLTCRNLVDHHIQ